jgi:glutaredoxin
VNYLNELRIEELNAIEEQISTDTLSLETQFALLAEAPCEDIQEGNILSDELGGLGDRLSFAEERLSANDPEVIRLKERYTLLQIRDYLLGKRLREACDLESVVALYFYSNEGDCPDCDRAGYALSYLRQTYPALRVYSFDYHLDLGALRTLIAVEKIDDTLPAFVIDGKQTYGFTDLEALEGAFPKAMFLSASSTASTTSEN